MVKVAMLMAFLALVAGSFTTPMSGDPVFLRSAGQASSEADLQLWRDEQVQRVHAFVPLAHQQFALHSIEQEYTQRLSQLGGSASVSNSQSLPAFLFLTSAKRCQSVEELQSWHTTQLDQIRRIVPVEYQQVGLDSIEGEFQKHAVRLSQLAAVHTSGATASTAPSVEELPVLQINAEEYRTQKELEDWRGQQAEQIERFVPSDYQQIALDSVNQEFEMRVADLHAKAHKGQENLSSDVPANFGLTHVGKAARFGAIFALATLLSVAAGMWKGKQNRDGDVYLLAGEEVTA